MRLDYKEYLIWWILWMILGTVFVATIVWAFNSAKEWRIAVKQVETSTGCEYIGSPKGANRVGYFDCNGVIETKRIPK
jgi:hypothetical protein